MPNSSETHKIAVVILAAGRGKRIGGELPKAAVQTADGSLVQLVLKVASSLNAESTVVVTGYKRSVVEESVRVGALSGAYSDRGLTFVEQRELLGTGDAVKSALPALSKFLGSVVILCGDVPLLKPETLKRLVEHHHSTSSTVTVLSAHQPLPNSYGRIVRTPDHRFVEQIVEARDCTAEQLLLTETNTGTYVVDSAFLAPALEKLTNSNAQKEYYLTDIVAIASREGQTVSALALLDASEALGVNTPEELLTVNAVLQKRTISRWASAGVQFIDPNSVFMDSSVSIGSGSTIGPAVQLRGSTTIGSNVTIEGTALLIDCSIADNAEIKLGVRAEGARIGEGAMVGPFAHLRSGTDLGPDVKIGNFVETKKATLGKGAKASHLTYLGDCSVGSEANIGAGTITCNYDGYQKSTTIIGKGAFIGSNTSLVAPVTVGDGATIGAGSTITKDVPSDALALTRAPQETRDGWSKRKRSVMEAKKGGSAPTTQSRQHKAD